MPYNSEASTQYVIGRRSVELRQEEARHQELIKETMAKVPADDGFDPDDFVDEPAAQ